MGYVVASSLHSSSINQPTEQNHTRITTEQKSYFEKLTDPIIPFTFLLMVFTGLLWLVSRQQANDARVTQRAYVKMSHNPPGLNFNSTNGEYVTITMSVDITNHGHTPTKISDVHLTNVVLPKRHGLPPEPRYQRERGTRNATKAFLVANGDHFFFHWGGTVARADLEDIRAGRKFLYIFGYVDYRDLFGVRHRGGYARRYEPLVDKAEPNNPNRNNLVFADEPRYDYDRERKRGEGNDWDERV